MNLYVGMLIQSSGGEGQNRTERVVGISNLGADIITVDIFNPRGLPVRSKRVDLEASLAAGEVRTLSDDPYATLRRPEHDIDANQ
jgi:hypothetical protein